jgi:fructose-1,6-bisphosphatase II
MMSGEEPQRNLALELVRVTEAAAMAAGRFMGRNDKIGGDRAAVNAMRLVLNTVEMDGIVVIGEGEKDEAPMLFNGERLGTGRPPELDIAVDPIDGTRLLALGRANSLSTVAVSDRHTMWNPGPFVYMNKIAVARAKGCEVNDLTVVILDRDRHAELISEVRKAGARIRLITDGDVAGALMTAWPDSGIDLLMGVGGTPEGVLSACALKCMGGEIQGKIYPRNQDETDRGRAAGYDVDKVFQMDDLVASDNVFFAATGITDGELLDGVKYFGSGARTHSLVMRSKSGTVREVIAQHRLDKLMQFSAVAFD